MRPPYKFPYDEEQLPRWVAVATVILGIIGCILAASSVWTHLQATTPGLYYQSFCNINATLNCDAVAKSKWAAFLGIPLGSYAFVFYLITIFFGIISFFLRKIAAAHIQLFVSAVVLLFSITLLIISITDIGALCLVCLGMDVVNLLLFLVPLLSVRFNSALSSHNLSQSFANGIKKTLEFPKALFGIGEYRGSGESISVLAGFLFAIVINFLTLYGTNQAKMVLKERSQNDYSVEQYENELKRIIDEWRNAPPQEIPVSFEDGPLVDYSIGDKDAPIRIVEFSDMQCPFCRKVFATIEEAIKGYEDKVVFISKNFPIDPSCNPTIEGLGHPYSCLAAKYARCAGEQGKFWQVLKSFYLLPELELDSTLGDPLPAMKNTLRQFNINMDYFNDCLISDKVSDKIQEDINIAGEVGITGTPSFWVNGKRLKAAEPKLLHIIFDEILKQKKAQAK
jgi:protein-disulfide isomerase/uncharacterized membrane protein